MSNLQVRDFVITHDARRLVAVSTTIKRQTVDNKPRPSMSARVAAGKDVDETSGFGYKSMERNLVLIDLANYEIIG
jgi:hypothetical protein